jgi:Putative transposase of IS4/5 family (DUF4096)
MPKRDPRCKLGYHHVFNLILWVLYTGMQWKCLPVPKMPDGTDAIHYTTVYRAFARWAEDGSLEQAFVASVAHLSVEPVASFTNWPNTLLYLKISVPRNDLSYLQIRPFDRAHAS